MLSGIGSIIRHSRSLVLALVLSLFTVSCATTSSYTTRAYSTVPQPALTSTDYSAWLNYYTDQLQTYGERVALPPVNYPEEAKKAYADAKLTWDQQVSIIKKSEQRQNNETLLYLGAGIGTTLVLLLAL
jgi:hypothetical protein